LFQFSFVFIETSKQFCFVFYLNFNISTNWAFLLSLMMLCFVISHFVRYFSTFLAEYNCDLIDICQCNWIWENQNKRQ
jgi:hypothetical protein